MTRQEFLDTLQMQLQGRLDPAQIEGHLHYYREYISEAVAAGRPENEVLEELGSPVQIAQTLASAADFADSYEEPYAGEPKVKVFLANPQVLKFVILAALLFILFLVLSGLGFVLSLLARYFLPILLIVLIIKLIRSK